MKREAELLQILPFAGFRADEVYPADIDGDGQIEYLFLQSPGIYQSAVFDGGYWAIPREEQAIYCLTAVDRAGHTLWQYGTPWLKSLRYGSHVADQMVWCGLLSHEHSPEIAILQKDALHILDGATGSIRRSRKLDADNYTIVRPIRCRQGTRLLIKNSECAYGERWYGDPAHIFDAALNPVVVLERSVGSGHSPRTLDINGDGDDEILIGYEAYNAGGRRLWRLEGQPADRYDPILHHVDQIQAGPLGPAGERRILYAGSLNVMMGTPDGHLVWKRDFGHPQHVLLGDFRRGSLSAPIAIYSCDIGLEQRAFAAKRGMTLPTEQRLNMAWLNREGEIVDLVFPTPHWPASTTRTGPTHSGEGMLVYPEGCPDGSDAVITRDWGWPHALTLSGESAFEFPYPGVTIGAGQDDPVGPDGYGIRIGDFNHDGRAEVLIHDRTTAWLFRPPLPDAGACGRQAKLEPVTGQGWYAFK